MNPVKLVSAATISVALLAGAAVAAFSHHYWGYAFVRPGVVDLARDATSVSEIVAVSNWYPKAAPTLQRSGDWREAITMTENDPYDMPAARGLIRWRDEHLLETDIADVPLDVANRAVERIDTLFPAGEGVYAENARNRSGIVARFDTATEKGLLLVAMRGGQVSNDHYAYREAVLRPAGNGYEIAAQTGFFYDVAGIEYLEFAFVFPVILVLSALLAGALLGAWALGAKLISAKKSPLNPSIS